MPPPTWNIPVPVTTRLTGRLPITSLAPAAGDTQQLLHFIKYIFLKTYRRAPVSLRGAGRCVYSSSLTLTSRPVSVWQPRGISPPVRTCSQPESPLQTQLFLLRDVKLKNTHKHTHS